MSVHAHELLGVAARRHGDVVRERKVLVADLDELRARAQDGEDVLARERVLAEALLDLRQDGLVLLLVQQALQGDVLASEAVEEVLAEDVRDVRVRRLLDCTVSTVNQQNETAGNKGGVGRCGRRGVPLSLLCWKSGRKGVLGRQYRSEASLVIWRIDASSDGALASLPACLR